MNLIYLHEKCMLRETYKYYNTNSLTKYKPTKNTYTTHHISTRISISHYQELGEQIILCKNRTFLCIFLAFSAYFWGFLNAYISFTTETEWNLSRRLFHGAKSEGGEVCEIYIQVYIYIPQVFLNLNLIVIIS